MKNKKLIEKYLKKRMEKLFKALIKTYNNEKQEETKQRKN